MVNYDRVGEIQERLEDYFIRYNYELLPFLEHCIGIFDKLYYLSIPIDKFDHLINEKSELRQQNHNITENERILNLHKDIFKEFKNIKQLQPIHAAYISSVKAGQAKDEKMLALER